MSDIDEVQPTPKKVIQKLEVSGLFGSDTPDAEKPALKSKKFIAFLVSSLGFLALAFVMLWKTDIEKLGGNFAFMTVIVTQGFMAVGYILGQSYLDKYVRVAQMGFS